MQINEVLPLLIKPYEKLILPEVSNESLCFAISRFGIIRHLPPTAIQIEHDPDNGLGVTELWLLPPRHYTAWTNFTGMIHMFSEGRFGLHIAERQQVTGEVHSKPGYSSYRMQGELLCTFSLDTWTLEARCELKS